MKNLKDKLYDPELDYTAKHISKRIANHVYLAVEEDIDWMLDWKVFFPLQEAFDEES